MKILYAIQGTGNGHLSRAGDIAPELEKYGEVDYMVSGMQADIPFAYPISYKSKGMSFYFGKKGGVNISKTIRKNLSTSLYKEIQNFPVEKYDLIINDFEPISAWAAKLKGKPCVAVSHQSALRSPKSPLPPEIDQMGKMILQHYAPATTHYGFHFSSFDSNIFTPIVRKSIRKLEPVNKGHYTVYLPAYDDEKIIKTLSQLTEVQWEVFSKHTKKDWRHENIHINPIQASKFTESIVACEGVLCGAGFETPSEALYLGKKLMVIPMKNQYEQHCNTAALTAMGVAVLKKLKPRYVDDIRNWVENRKAIQVAYPDETAMIVEKIIAEN